MGLWGRRGGFLIGTASDITSYVHLLTFVDLFFHSHDGIEIVKIRFWNAIQTRGQDYNNNQWLLFINNALDFQTLGSNGLIAGIFDLSLILEAEGGRRCMVREYSGDVIVRFL